VEIYIQEFKTKYTKKLKFVLNAFLLSYFLIMPSVSYETYEFYNFDTHGYVHRRLLSRNTNKMQLVIEFIIPKFFEGSTCFERHTAHNQEL
jgi:hypothetical protein